MLVIAWVTGMLLLTQFFGYWEKNRVNPNQNPESSRSGEVTQTVLKRNHVGHYLAGGKINNTPVVFMLDTGATDVVIPQQLAKSLNLPKYGQGVALTANGRINIIQTKIDTIDLGKITLHDVRASINPAMGPNEPVLLGMSALRQVNFKQDGNRLILEQVNRSIVTSPKYQ